MFSLTAVLLAVRFMIGARSGRVDVVTDLVIALAIVGVLLFILVAVPVSRAGKATAAARASDPDAVVATAYWADGYTDFFLKPGPLTRHALGRGGYVLIVADRRGIELRKTRGSFSFGLISWGLVKEIRLEELSGALASRPKLVFEINGSGTPFQDRFELLPTGKEERSRASMTLDAILAKRPATQP